MSGNESDRLPAVAVAVAAAEPSPSTPPRILPRLGRLMIFGALIVVGAAWGDVHLDINWLKISLIAMAMQVLPTLYGLLVYTVDKDKLKEELAPWIAGQVDRASSRAVLVPLAIAIAGIGLLFCTIEIRGLPEETRVTIPAFVGSGERTEVAVKDQPLRLHFLFPFREIVIASDRHAKTTARTWPFVPHRVYAAHLTPQAGVLLRLPVAALRYLEGGEFVIGNQRYPTNDDTGAILIGGYPATKIRAEAKSWLFDGSVEKNAQERAIKAWSNPVEAPVPREQSFRVAFTIAHTEVAVTEGVRLPEIGLRDVEMKWTYGKGRP